MSAEIINLAALRMARLLAANAPDPWIDRFLQDMTAAAAEQCDVARLAFWHDVASRVQAPLRGSL